MSIDKPTADSLQLADYVRVIGRRRWILLGGAVIGAVLGWLFVTYSGPEYRSTASVLVNPVNVNPDSSTARPDQLVNLPTERERIFSAAITARAAEIMEYEGSPAGLVDRLTVVIPEGTQILEVSFTAGRPETAQAGAQAFADAYLENRGDQADRFLQERQEQIEEEIALVSENLVDANRRLVSAEDGSLERALAEADIQLLSARMRDLQQDRAESDLISVDPGEVIAPALVPNNPVSQPPWLVVAVGALAGMVLSLPVAFGRERFDDRIWDAADLAQTGLPVVGQVSLDRPYPGGKENLHHLEAAQAEAFRRFSLNVMSSMATTGGTRAAVASATLAGGDPAVVIELAVATAHMGHHVLLMDAEQDPDSITDLLPTTHDLGLSDVLADNRSIGEVIQIIEELPQLRVMLQGRSRPGEVPWDDFAGLIQKLPGSTDVLMVNAPPVLETADSLRICSLMDGVVLIAHRGRTRRSELTQASGELRRAGATPIGVVYVEAG